MKLYAVDGGTDARTGTATVTVYVTDVNDNRPRFSKPLYELCPPHAPMVTPGHSR